MILRNSVILKFLIPLILIHETKNSEISPNSLTRRLQKRGLFYPVLLYPYNACSGILVAIAVPLQLDSRNVFVSYNFEINYNMPNQPSDSYPGPIQRFPGLIPPDLTVKGPSPGAVVASRKLEGGNDTESATEQETSNIQESPSRILLTRKSIYQMLESRMRSIGIDGKKCLLRIICDGTKNSMIEANGILGHIFHILLTPSSSKDEGFPLEYYKAEESGRSGNCLKYQNKCPFSLIDNFSKLIG